jgi:hypothetical protein
MSFTDTITVAQLAITALGVIVSIAGMIILGWINVRTKIVALEVKLVDLESRITENKAKLSRHENSFLEIKNSVNDMKVAIVEKISDLKIQISAK